MIQADLVNITYRHKSERVVATSTRAVSYLDDGRQVVCEAPDPLVCDAERYDRPVRVALAERHRLPTTNPSFAIAWTRAETIAKLVNEPLLAVLSHIGDLNHDVVTVLDDSESIVVSFAAKN